MCQSHTALAVLCPDKMKMFVCVDVLYAMTLVSHQVLQFPPTFHRSANYPDRKRNRPVTSGSHERVLFTFKGEIMLWNGLRASRCQNCWIDGWLVSSSTQLCVNLSALFNFCLSLNLVTMYYSHPSCKKCLCFCLFFSHCSRDSHSTPEISWAISTEVDYSGSAQC